MVFFKSVLKAFSWGVGIAFAALLLSAAGITVFASTINSYPGFLLFFFLLLGFVLWKDY